MDREFLGQRRRALEEDYFAKLNRALRDKLRAAEVADVKPHEDIPAGELNAHLNGKKDI